MKQVQIWKNKIKVHESAIRELRRNIKNTEKLKRDTLNNKKFDECKELSNKYFAKIEQSTGFSRKYCIGSRDRDAIDIKFSLISFLYKEGLNDTQIAKIVKNERSTISSSYKSHKNKLNKSDYRKKVAEYYKIFKS